MPRALWDRFARQDLVCSIVEPRILGGYYTSIWLLGSAPSVWRPRKKGTNASA